MARTAGSRNQDFDEARADLAERIAAHMLSPGGVGASLRELAAAAGVTPPTLRHYFGDRAGALAAAFAQRHAEGEPYLALVRRAPDRPVAEALPALLHFVVQGLRAGVARQLVVGLADGSREPVVGTACVTECLEPVLSAVEARLAHHAARGELRVPDVRAAALALVSPVALAVLHQDALGGDRVRPLDLAAFIATLSDGFLRGHAVAAASRPGAHRRRLAGQPGRKGRGR